MPTYEYACQACGHRFEAAQKIIEAPLTDCPECHKDTLKKLISASGIVFKGSGWSRADKGGARMREENPMPTCGTGACSSCPMD